METEFILRIPTANALSVSKGAGPKAEAEPAGEDYGARSREGSNGLSGWIHRRMSREGAGKRGADTPKRRQQVPNGMFRR